MSIFTSQTTFYILGKYLNLGSTTLKADLKMPGESREMVHRRIWGGYKVIQGAVLSALLGICTFHTKMLQETCERTYSFFKTMLRESRGKKKFVWKKAVLAR